MFITDVAAKEANGKEKKANGSNGSTPNVENATQILPGYQQTVYDRLVPEIFGMIMSPDFNSKDGQSQLVSRLGRRWKVKLTTSLRSCTRYPACYAKS